MLAHNFPHLTRDSLLSPHQIFVALGFEGKLLFNLSHIGPFEDSRHVPNQISDSPSQQSPFSCLHSFAHSFLTKLLAYEKIGSLASDLCTVNPSQPGFESYLLGSLKGEAILDQGRGDSF